MILKKRHKFIKEARNTKRKKVLKERLPIIEKIETAVKELDRDIYKEIRRNSIDFSSNMEFYVDEKFAKEKGLFLFDELLKLYEEDSVALRSYRKNGFQITFNTRADRFYNHMYVSYKSPIDKARLRFHFIPKHRVPLYVSTEYSVVVYFKRGNRVEYSYIIRH